jgi:hypothetical protein
MPYAPCLDDFFPKAQQLNSWLMQADFAHQPAAAVGTACTCSTECLCSESLSPFLGLSVATAMPCAPDSTTGWVCVRACNMFTLRNDRTLPASCSSTAALLHPLPDSSAPITTPCHLQGVSMAHGCCCLSKISCWPWRRPPPLVGAAAAARTDAACGCGRPVCTAVQQRTWQ